LSRSGIAYEIWPCPPGEPMDKDVFRTVEHLLSVQCDGIIALGGGSVLDAAKAVAVLAANPDLPLADMMPGAALNPRLPFIAIP
ncbi:iron-containing alcohol dehydrogenase, partial [Klebsiella pneumoniae]